MRWLRPALGLFITLAFVGLIVRHANWAEVGTVWSQATSATLLLAVLLLGADMAVRVLRWGVMLRAIDVPISAGSVGWPFMVGIALNNILPFRMGDIARMFAFKKEFGVGAASVAATLLIERLLDAIALLVFFFLGVLLIDADSVPQSFRFGAGVLAGGAAGAFALVLLLPKQLRSVANGVLAFSMFNGVPGYQLRQLVANLFSSVELIARPALMWRLVGLSLIAWSLEGAVFLTVAESLSVNVPGIGAWFAMALGTLATLVPSAPGYIGTFDYFAIIGFASFGVSASAATATVLLVHIVIWLPPTVAGGLYLLVPRRHAVPVRFPRKEKPF